MYFLGDMESGVTRSQKAGFRKKADAGHHVFPWLIESLCALISEISGNRFVIIKMAEGEGFEPPEPFLVQRFSRPPHSTTLPSFPAMFESSK